MAQPIREDSVRVMLRTPRAETDGWLDTDEFQTLSPGGSPHGYYTPATSGSWFRRSAAASGLSLLAMLCILFKPTFLTKTFDTVSTNRDPDPISMSSIPDAAFDQIDQKNENLNLNQNLNLEAEDPRDLLSGSLFRNLLPSIYLMYNYPIHTEKQAWFQGMKVLSSATTTFFAVQRTQFGYLGLQQTFTFLGWLAESLGLSLNEDIASTYYGIAIFSVWDETNNPCTILKVGEGASGETFSGEGTGCKITMNAKWATKTEYGFMTTVEELGSGYIALNGYWHNPGDADSWNFLGSIKTLKNSRRFGEGGIASFVEQYIPVAHRQTRAAEFKDGFVQTLDCVWTPISSARYAITTSSETDVTTIAQVTTDNDFMLAVTGSSTGYPSSTAGTTLRLDSTRLKSAYLVDSLTSWMQQARASTLPSGCDGTSCGMFSWLKIQSVSFINIFIPSNLEQWVFFILINLFVGAVVVAVMFWLRPQMQFTDYLHVTNPNASYIPQPRSHAKDWNSSMASTA